MGASPGRIGPEPLDERHPEAHQRRQLLPCDRIGLHCACDVDHDRLDPRVRRPIHDGLGPSVRGPSAFP